MCEEVFRPGLRHVALAGDLARGRARPAELARALAGWTVHPQRGDGFAERLVNAHADVAPAAGAPVVQIGMDTPHAAGRGARRRSPTASATATTRCSARPRTAAGGCSRVTDPASPAACARCRCRPPGRTPTRWPPCDAPGATVATTGVLRDVDTADDADARRRRRAGAPGSRALASTVRPRRGCAVTVQVGRTLGVSLRRLRAPPCAGTPCTVHGAGRRCRTGCRCPGGPAAPTPRDAALLAHCRGPVARRRLRPGPDERATSPARGVQRARRRRRRPRPSPQTRAAGASALHRDVFDHAARARAAGRARCSPTATSASAGTRSRLLRRVRGLLAPDGRVVVDLALPGTGDLRTRSSSSSAAASAPSRSPGPCSAPSAVPGVAAAAGLRVDAVHDARRPLVRGPRRTGRRP